VVDESGKVAVALYALGDYKEIYSSCEVAHKQANYLNCRRGSKMQPLNTLQSGMFNETSEDLPLFSGQDYGPEDKGPFNPPEVNLQGSLLDMRPSMSVQEAADRINNRAKGLPPAGFNEDYGDTTVEPGKLRPNREADLKEIFEAVAENASSQRIRKGVRVCVMVDGYLKYRGTCISANPNRAYAGAPDEYDIELDDDNFGYIYAKFEDYPNGIEVQEEVQGQTSGDKARANTDPTTGPDFNPANI
jgi:hypothetical protein